MHFTSLTKAAAGLAALSSMASAATIAPRDGTCTNPTIRKEWRELSATEQQDYLRAALCIRQLPGESYPENSAVVSLMDDLTYTHRALNTQIHFVAQFLPWHRWFVVEHERLLREKCGYQGVQPYWDWSIDADALNVPNSPLFDPVTGFGGNGVRTGSTEPGFQRCVADGTFANTTITLGMGWPDDNVVGNRPHCFSREFNGGLGIDPTTGEQIIGDMQASAYNTRTMQRVYAMPDFDNMANILEGLPHAQVHSILFGDMGPATSPNEPLFMLHHANIDRAWAKWQGRDAARLVDYSGFRDQADTIPATLDDPLQILNLPGSPIVRNYMDTLANGLCYQYST